MMQELKNAGAKRMVVVGMPPLGCLPMDVTKINLNSSRGNLFRRDCKDEHNSDAQEYNTKLQALVKKISSPSMKIAYMDIYTPLMNMIKTPKTYSEIIYTILHFSLNYNILFIHHIHIFC